MDLANTTVIWAIVAEIPTTADGVVIMVRAPVHPVQAPVVFLVMLAVEKDMDHLAHVATNLTTASRAAEMANVLNHQLPTATANLATVMDTMETVVRKKEIVVKNVVTANVPDHPGPLHPSRRQLIPVLVHVLLDGVARVPARVPLVHVVLLKAIAIIRATVTAYVARMTVHGEDRWVAIVVNQRPLQRSQRQRQRNIAKVDTIAEDSAMHHKGTVAKVLQIVKATALVACAASQIQLRPQQRQPLCLLSRANLPQLH